MNSFDSCTEVSTYSVLIGHFCPEHGAGKPVISKLEARVKYIKMFPLKSFEVGRNGHSGEEGRPGFLRHVTHQAACMLNVFISLTGNIVCNILEILFSTPTNNILLRHPMLHQDVLREEDSPPCGVVWHTPESLDKPFSLAYVAGGVVCMNVLKAKALEYEVV